MATFPEVIRQSALLILILLVLRPVFKKVLGARFRYALWLLPALRLMVPFSVQSAMSIWNIVQPAIPTGLSTAGNSGMTQALAGITVPPIAPTVITTASQTMQATSPSLDALRAMPLNWIQLLSSIGIAVWSLGSLASLAMMVRNNIRIAQRLRGTKRIPMDSKVPVMLADLFPSPCLVGLLRPRITITTEVFQSKMLLDMVLRHELTHYRRRDHLWTALRSILLCLWWWNPLVWLAAHYSREDCEAACDEAVICRMSLEGRQQYGMSLIALLRITPSTRSLLLTTTAMQSSKRAMKERITMIANWKNKGRCATICAIACTVILFPLLCTSALGQKGNNDAIEQLIAKWNDEYKDTDSWNLSKRAQEDPNQIHGVPGEGMITHLDAIRILLEYITKEYDTIISLETVATFEPHIAFRINYSSPQWQIDLTPPNMDGGLSSFTAYIFAETGEINYVLYDSGNG